MSEPMLKLSYRTAFLISLPTIIPLIIFCLDFFGAKKEFKSFVNYRSSYRGRYEVNFNNLHDATSLSKEDYYSVQLHDSAIIEKGALLNITYKFTLLRQNKIIRGTDYLYVILICCMSSIPFAISLLAIFNKKGSNPIETKDSSPYWSFLVVGYVLAIAFIYLTNRNI